MYTKTNIDKLVQKALTEHAINFSYEKLNKLSDEKFENFSKNKKNVCSEPETLTTSTDNFIHKTIQEYESDSFSKNINNFNNLSELSYEEVITENNLDLRISKIIQENVKLNFTEEKESLNENLL